MIHLKSLDFPVAKVNRTKVSQYLHIIKSVVDPSAYTSQLYNSEGVFVTRIVMVDEPFESLGFFYNQLLRQCSSYTVYEELEDDLCDSIQK